MGPQKIRKIHFLTIFGGPLLPPLKFVIDSEGTFITFQVQQDPIEKKNQKIIILGVN